MDEAKIRELVDEQAADEGLWFEAETCAEAYVQQALRRLHAVIEGQPPEKCAIAVGTCKRTEDAMQHKFVNEQHERAYSEAVALLVSEDNRQKQEAKRLYAEWARLPERERKQKEMLLLRHFWECRQPYVKLVADLLVLATPVYIARADGQQLREE